jgi:hypothetical protein
LARQRYCGPSAPYDRATPVSPDRATCSAPHTRGKSPAFRRRKGISRETRTVRWRKPDSNSWSHFSARATLSFFATSRFQWDLAQLSFRTDLASDPARVRTSCSRGHYSVGPASGLAGYAIIGCFELDEAALVECALTSCPVLKRLATFGVLHGRAAHDPFPAKPGWRRIFVWSGVPRSMQVGTTSSPWR